MHTTNRRSFLFGSLQALAVSTLAGCRALAPLGVKRRYALNPPTVKGYGLSLRDQVRLAIAAGFDGIEPWMKDLHAAKASGELKDIVSLARDNNFAFVNGIAFGSWANDDSAKRAAGLDETKRDMEVLKEVGCPTIAASLFGSHKAGSRLLEPETIAERYAAVCDLGRKMGVRPLLEYWGHSVNMHTPGEALKVIALSRRENVGLLPDVYHTYRGGGTFATFRHFTSKLVPVLHMNDYPAQPSRTELTDADRVWPGDGIAPWREIFAALDATGTNPWLSVELFNPAYWKTTPEETLRTALEKMRTVAEA